MHRAVPAGSQNIAKNQRPHQGRAELVYPHMSLAALISLVLTPISPESTPMALTLPPLPYALSALEPHIDAKTMEIHSQKHHKAYVDNGNKALEGTKLAELPPEQIIAKLADAPDEKRAAIRNNVGGHVNHAMFFLLMAPHNQGGGGEPTGELADLIKAAFGGFPEFKTAFQTAGATRFGSGWAWLCYNKAAGKLEICSTANQDNPLMGKTIASCEGTPILGCDVWEHAYYLNYQNRRPDYMVAWWNVVNWSQVVKNLAAAK